MKKLVVISGWAGSHASLQPIGSQLSDSFDISLLGIHDLGRRQAKFLGPRGMSAYARGLTDALAADDMQGCILMGLSMGGMVALECALTSAIPVGALVLVSTSAKFSSGSDFRHGFDPAGLSRMRKQLVSDREKALRRFVELASLPYPLQTDTATLSVEAIQDVPISELDAGLAYIQHTDWRNDLGRISCPTLVCHGKKDAVIPWRAGKHLADSISTAEWFLEPAAGHDFALRSPRSIAEHVRRFARRL